MAGAEQALQAGRDGRFLFAEYLLYLLGGLFAATAGLLGFVLQFLAQKPGFVAILARLRMLLAPTSPGSDPGLWGTRGALGKLTLVLASLFVLLMALIALLRLLFLLDQPLGG